MALMSNEQFRNASAKLRDRLLRLTLKKLREINDKYFARPPARRLGKEARAHGAAKRPPATRR